MFTILIGLVFGIVIVFCAFVYLFLSVINIINIVPDMRLYDTIYQERFVFIC